jgi:hypothetical protein
MTTRRVVLLSDPDNAWLALASPIVQCVNTSRFTERVEPYLKQVDVDCGQ